MFVRLGVLLVDFVLLLLGLGQLLLGFLQLGLRLVDVLL